MKLPQWMPSGLGMGKSDSNSAQKGFTSLFEPASTILSSEKKTDMVGPSFTRIIESLFCALIFVLPSFFLPFTSDLLNVNKSFLVIFVAGISLVLFFLSGAERKLSHILSIESYFGMLILVLAGGLSTAFSTSWRRSLYGGYADYTSSFSFLLALFVIGFISSNIKIKFDKIAKYFVLGVSLQTLFSLAVYFGAKIPGLDTTLRTATLTGSISMMFAIQAVSILLALVLASKFADMKMKVVYMLTIALNLSYLAFGLDKFAIAILVIGLFALSLDRNKHVKFDLKTHWLAILFVGLLVFVNYYPVTRNALGVQDMLKSQRLPVKESWYISVESVRDFPFWGSGLGTFIDNFTIYKPITLNSTDMWDTNFRYPFNDIFLWLSTAGLFGVSGFILFWWMLLKEVKKLDVSNPVNFLAYVSLLAVVLGILLLGNNIYLYLLAFILYGYVLQTRKASVLPLSGVSIHFALAGVSLIIFGLSCFMAYTTYKAQYYFRLGLSSPSIDDQYKYVGMAVLADPHEEYYYRTYVLANLNAAKILSSRQNLNQQELDFVTELVRRAVRSVRVLTELINPRSSVNWSLRGDVFASLIGVSQGADTLAIEAYSNGINLDKRNPRNWVSVGSVYYRLKSYVQAAGAFNNSIVLKNDYPNAHYNLAYALKDAGDLPRAVVQLEIVTRLVPVGSPDYEKATKELEEFRKLAEEAQKAKAAEVANIEVAKPTNPDEFTRKDKVSEGLANPSDRPETKLPENATEEVKTAVEEGVVRENTENEGPVIEAPLTKPPVQE